MNNLAFLKGYIDKEALTRGDLAALGLGGALGVGQSATRLALRDAMIEAMGGEKEKRSRAYNILRYIGAGALGAGTGLGLKRISTAAYPAVRDQGRRRICGPRADSGTGR